LCRGWTPRSAPIDQSFHLRTVRVPSRAPREHGHGRNEPDELRYENPRVQEGIHHASTTKRCSVTKRSTRPSRRHRVGTGCICGGDHS
jgi:hypothetical protein